MGPWNPVRFESKDKQEDRWMEVKDSESSFAETVPTGPWHLFPGLPHWEAEPSKEIEVKQIGMESILGGCTFPAPTHKQYFFFFQLKEFSITSSSQKAVVYF